MACSGLRLSAWVLLGVFACVLLAAAAVDARACDCNCCTGSYTCPTTLYSSEVDECSACTESLCQTLNAGSCPTDGPGRIDVQCDSGSHSGSSYSFAGVGLVVIIVVLVGACVLGTCFCVLLVGSVLLLLAIVIGAMLVGRRYFGNAKKDALDQPVN